VLGAVLVADVVGAIVIVADGVVWEM